MTRREAEIAVKGEVESVQVAIVGGGLSGLAAARCFSQAGFTNFKIFEASSRVGGRTFADEDGTDLGGAYIGPTQDRIMQIVDELGLRLRKVNTGGKTVQLLDGQVQQYDGMIPPVSLLGALDLNAAMVQMDAFVSGVNMASPHLSNDATRLDRMTAEEIICEVTYTEDARKILRTAIRSILCVEPCQLSDLYLMWYMAQSGGVPRIFETKDGAQDCKVVGGAGQIAPLLAKKYTPEGSNRLQLDCPIRSLEVLSPSSLGGRGERGDNSSNGSKDGERSESTDKTPSSSSSSPPSIRLVTSTGKVILAHHVILAIPPTQMLRIQYSPPLPAARYTALQNWPMGCICKTFMYYDTPFWRDENHNGMIVCDEGIVCVSYDDTNEDGTHPCLMGFVLANQALLPLSSEERKQAICRRYQECFNSDQALRPVRYKEKMWAEEQWVGGCYVGSVGPNVLTASQRVQCEVYASVVHVAGTEAAYRGIGYMDGAVESGERVGRNVLVDLGVLTEEHRGVVSTPPPSHQLPFVPMQLSSMEKWLLPSVGTVLGGMAVVVAVAVVMVGNLYSPKVVSGL